MENQKNFDEAAEREAYEGWKQQERIQRGEKGDAWLAAHPFLAWLAAKKDAAEVQSKMSELLKRAEGLVGNPCTNISSGTDLACMKWQQDYIEWLAAKKDALKADPEPGEEPAKYLIWSGDYVGNAMAWWGPEGRGYTTDIDGAGRFDEDKARRITQDSKHTAFPEDYILAGHPGRVKRTVDSQYVDREMALK